MGQQQALLCAEVGAERIEVVRVAGANSLHPHGRSIAPFPHSCRETACDIGESDFGDIDTLHTDEYNCELGEANKRHRTISIAMTSADVSLA